MNKLLGFVLVHTLILILRFALWSEDEPYSLYLTWQHSPSSSMSIQWISKEDKLEDNIEFQCEGETIWGRIQGKHMPLPSGLPYLIHHAELSELQPASTYFFRIGAEGKIYKFRTMPKTIGGDPIHFVVGGDMYNGTLEMMANTNRAAASKEPLFAVIGGDIAYSATKDISKPEDSQKWLDWLRVWKETMVTPKGYLIPIIPAIGNHEVCGGTNRTCADAAFFYSLFPMPGCRGYNVLDFDGYMSLIILDSGHTNPIEGKQTEWLRKILAQRCWIPHKFAVYHIPAYPCYRNFNSADSRSIRQNWVPLFEKYGLHAAFENNDHAYKRTHLLLNGRAQSQGVLYLGDGAWSVGNVRRPKAPKHAWYLAKSIQTQYFMIVTLEGSHRLFQAFSPDGTLIDEVSQ